MFLVQFLYRSNGQTIDIDMDITRNERDGTLYVKDVPITTGIVDEPPKGSKIEAVSN